MIYEVSQKDNKTKDFLRTCLPAQENGFVNFLGKINFILRVDGTKCNVIEWMQCLYFSEILFFKRWISGYIVKQPIYWTNLWIYRAN